MFNGLNYTPISQNLNTCHYILKILVMKFTLAFILQFFYLLFSELILIRSYDIETNPGPSETKEKSLSVCHWNLNSLWVNNFEKISLISAFLNTHQFDILCLSETFLDSSIADNDPRLLIEGYNLLRSDNSSNVKKGGVCLYYKEVLPLVNRIDLSNLNECLVCELKLGKNHIFLTALYRSPSQSIEQFSTFKQQLEETIVNINNCSPTMSLLLGDFNARNYIWFEGDTTNKAGLDLADITSIHSLSQIIKEPTHVLPNSSSCIDLIFTSSENLITDSGVLPSLFSRCHHQIIFCRLKFKVFHPPVYRRRIWDFARADSKNIKIAMSKINWHESFAKLNSVDERVSFLTDSLLNICSNYIPNRMIKVREKDAPWMTSEIKLVILEKAKYYRKYVKNGRTNADEQRLNEIRSRCRLLIKDRKSEYYKRLSDSLNDPSTSPKKYWSVLHRFLNKRKCPQIPPIRHGITMITKPSDKADIFNSFFAKQCSLLSTNSIIPDQQCYYTDTSLDSIEFDARNILRIIRSLNVNKAHGWDEISIRMIKICDETLVTPLLSIFSSAHESQTFPSLWKRGNITPCYKKGDKSLVKNYRPVSLLPIFGKIFEKCIYDKLYSYFEANNLFAKCQSGFRKGDSCTSQLLAIVHDIYNSFDANPSVDTRGIFLDISKAFDRVWHEGLLFKLQSYGIKGTLLGLIKDFLSNRLQRVVINGQSSSWKEILAGVPQGSLLGPLLFLIYINDLPLNLDSVVKIFADDTSLFSKVLNPTSGTILNRDMGRISTWANQWKMSFNPDTSKQAVEVYFSKKKTPTIPPPIHFNGIPVTVEPYQKHLGLLLDNKLNFNDHLNNKISNVNKITGLISRLRPLLPRNTLLTIYKSFARPHLDYADIVYDNPGNFSFIDRLERVQYNAALAITGCIRGTSRDKIYAELGLESLFDRRYCRKMCFFYKIVNGYSPQYLLSILPESYSKSYATRTSHVFRSVKSRTDRFQNSFFPFCVSQWNTLDTEIRNLTSISSFKSALSRFYRPTSSSVYNVHNPKGIVYLNRLRVGFSHLREHKFRHNFQDTIDPFCNCSTNSIETTEHYLLHCSNYSAQRARLIDDLKASFSLLPFNSAWLTRILLFGNSILSYDDNHAIITLTISFLLSTERFNIPLLT